MKLITILIAIAYFHISKGLDDLFHIKPRLSDSDITIPPDFDITNVKAFKCFDVSKSLDGEPWNPFTTPLDEIFDRYLNVYNKVYTEEELPQRRDNLVKSILQIVQCIIDSFLDQINVHYTLGLNSISDLNEDEFNALLGAQPGVPLQIEVFQRRSTSNDAVCQPTSNATLPSSLDWRTSYSKNCVTSVKNQLQCGDCWAFATTATIESQYLIKTNATDIDLSEEDLLNCASTQGCNGETIDAPMKWVMANSQAREAQAPYDATFNRARCFPSRTYPVINGVKISDYCSKGGTTYSTRRWPNGTVGTSAVKEDNPDSKIMRDLNDVGPLVFLMNATLIQGYASGIFDNINCTTDINHAVTVVGYGTENGTDYWTVKNSWGTNWGENGYLRIKRGVNMCGINGQYYYPIMTSTAPYNSPLKLLHNNYNK